MLHKCILISSILFLIGGAVDCTNSIVNVNFDIISAAGGAPNSYVAINEFYTEEHLSSFIAFAGTAYLFAFCPVTPLGAFLAGAGMLFIRSLIDIILRSSANPNISRVDILLRHFPKSVGASLYILLSTIPFAVDIAFIVALLIGALQASVMNSNSTNYGDIFNIAWLNKISIRWICGYYSLGLSIVTSIALLVIFILSLIWSINFSERPIINRNTIIAFCSFVLLIISLFGATGLWFAIPTALFLQTMSLLATEIFYALLKFERRRNA